MQEYFDYKYCLCKKVKFVIKLEFKVLKLISKICIDCMKQKVVVRNFLDGVIEFDSNVSILYNSCLKFKFIIDKKFKDSIKVS